MKESTVAQKNTYVCIIEKDLFITLANLTFSAEFSSECSGKMIFQTRENPYFANIFRWKFPRNLSRNSRQEKVWKNRLHAWGVIT
jgi:hypothetical protein